ncbi:MAG: PadR family transcriptional regulator, partial [Promethearchaeota archaeon]
MVENIAVKFEKAMKKGFISTLTLMVLEKEPMHGRQIKKAIEDRTFGGWEPTDSTIYTILKDLREKNLIRSIHIPGTDEKTITYEITDDGK